VRPACCAARLRCNAYFWPRGRETWVGSVIPAGQPPRAWLLRASPHRLAPCEPP
jgi:hypothetical protein